MGSTRTLKLCNSQKCPQDSVDFRAVQCAEYNSKRFRGWRYKWKPYTHVEGKSQIPRAGDSLYLVVFALERTAWWLVWVQRDPILLCEAKVANSFLVVSLILPASRPLASYLNLTSCVLRKKPARQLVSVPKTITSSKK